MTPAEQLAAGLAALAIDPDATQQRRLLAYGELLRKWNRSYSLTALAEPSQVVSHHLLDSLAILPFVDAGPLADVGSGGGMPGIPLALLRPQLAVTLVEANGKKAAFLRQAAIEAGLANVRVEHSRVEAWRPQVPQRVVTSRAFASLADFVAATRHLLAPGGRWLAMKGQLPEAEIAALPAGVAVDAVHPLQVPGVAAARHLVILREV